MIITIKFEKGKRIDTVEMNDLETIDEDTFTHIIEIFKQLPQDIMWYYHVNENCFYVTKAVSVPRITFQLIMWITRNLKDFNPTEYRLTAE